MTETLAEPSTDVNLDQEVVPYEDYDGTGNHLTHLIIPNDNQHLWMEGMTAKDIVAIARLAGAEVVALCGYKWVPKRNPDRFPICQKCYQAASAIVRGES
jgi:hypothetical protein